MKYKKLVVALTVISILAGSIIAYKYFESTKTATPKTTKNKSVVSVYTDVATYKTHVVSIEYPGRIASREFVRLTSEVTGKLLSADVQLKIGSRFKKGDIIVNIFSEDAKARLSAEKSLFLNTLSMALPDIRIDLAEEFDKWLSFFNEIELDGELPEIPKINTNKEKIYISTKNILSSYYNIKQSEIILSRYEIRAPFNGIFTSVNREVGSIAMPSAEIATITSTDVLEMSVGVFLRDAQNLNQGTEVIIISKSGKEYKGTIDRISSFVDPTTQRVNVYIIFYEPTLDIVEGQMLMVKMPSQDLEPSIAVSREALQGDSLIYTVKDNKLYSKKIDFIISTSTTTYIKGLEEGEIYVDESLVSPYDGMEVSILDEHGNQL